MSPQDKKHVFFMVLVLAFFCYALWRDRQFRKKYPEFFKKDR